MVWFIIESFALKFVLSALGFGPLGIVAGMDTLLLSMRILLTKHKDSIAAAFQGWAYGGFVPAGGFFVGHTAMGMRIFA